MKKLFLILLFPLNLIASDFANDETDFYVQGQDLNTALSTVNRFMCFVSNGISRGALLNKGPYKVLTRSDLCTKKFGESSSATDSSRTTSSVETQEESETNSFTDVNYNNAIFDVTKASLTAPLKAKIWSNVNPGSTDYRNRPPSSFFYDFTISKLPCTAARLAAGMVEGTDCTKYGNLTLDFTTTNPKDWAGIEPLWEYLGLSGASAVNKTTGMGRVEINDSTINYVANSGSDSYNLTLTSTGTVSKGLFEIFRPTISGNGWPWSLGYRFYIDTSKRVYCQKYEYANMLEYIAPASGGDKGSVYHWLDAGNKAGPRKLSDVSSLIAGVNDFTAWIKTNYIDPGYGIDEKCFDVNPATALRVVDHYRLYDSNGTKVDLTNKAFSITGTASGTNDFPNNQMYAYAGPNGVWLDHKYKNYVTNNTIWRNNNPNATALEKAKSYTVNQNFLTAKKINISYRSLSEYNKHRVLMWVQDPYWNTEFKNLGFCGIDNKDKNNNNCTFKKEYVGYYDSTLNGLDGDANTVGGFVFNVSAVCNADNCSYTVLTGSDVIQFENSQWISNMAKSFGSYTHVKSMVLLNIDTKKILRIKRNSLANPSSNLKANGVRNILIQSVPLTSMPTNLYCIARCMSPSAVNSSYESIFTAAAAIKSDANQSWEKTSISGNANRSPFSSPYYNVGPYIKSSEVNGSGALEYDWNHDSTVDYTKNNAVNTYQDGIRDSEKITYTISNNTVFVGADELTFNATNKNSIAAQANLNTYLTGARSSHWKGTIPVGWGLQGGLMMTQQELDKAECTKTFNDFGNANNEYEYRPGWNQAQSQEKRYCFSKIFDGSVEEYYSLKLRVAPTYNLMEGNSVVSFDPPKVLILTIPATSNYPTSEHGKKYRLYFEGDGNRIRGIPHDRYDIGTGTKVTAGGAWTATHRNVDRFQIYPGQEVTEVGTGNIYKIRPLKGQVYLLPMDKAVALELIGGGISDIPYDNSATIQSDSILRDVSPYNGSSSNSIGAEPTNVLNNGNPCVVDGIKDKSDTSANGCPFHSWAN